MALRDAICLHIEKRLEELGIHFKFPSASKVTYHKDSFPAMMAAGLEKVTVTKASLQAALFKGGIPCTVKDLDSRFNQYVAELAKDLNKMRVIVE